jgi:putative chitinase
MNSATKISVLFVFGMMVLVLAIAPGGKATADTTPDSQVPVIKTASFAVVRSETSTASVENFVRQRQSLTIEKLKPILVPKPGPAYKESQIVKHSHYHDPISFIDGLTGNSRRWGDATAAVQTECIVRLTNGLRAKGFTNNEVCFAVALCRHESGFNPDAAAGISSACGLGQFLDKTRRTLSSRAGVTSLNPFCVDLNVVCMQETLKECFAFARKHAKPDSKEYFAYAYAYHHDGPSLDAGGLEIAKDKVLPWLETAKRCISE